MGTALKEITKEEFEAILEKHQKWLDGEKDGERAVLRSIEFPPQILNGLELYECYFCACDFAGSNITDCQFDECKIIECGFEDCKISNCGFKRSEIVGCSFDGSDIINCDLSDCSISSCTLYIK